LVFFLFNFLGLHQLFCILTTTINIEILDVACNITTPISRHAKELAGTKLWRGVHKEQPKRHATFCLAEKLLIETKNAIVDKINWRLRPANQNQLAGHANCFPPIPSKQMF
jgi:hypothetical protein